VCNAGFRASGSTCEPIVSGQECAGVTCSGHGRCVVVQGMPNEPLCQCDAGYQVMGRTSCVAPADPCMNVDCNTGGTCAVAGGTAVCACGPGFQPSGRTRCVPLAAGDGGVCPAGNLVRNADFSLPAPWLKPLRPEFQVVQGRPDSNNHSTMVGNPPPAARLGSVGGTGGLRLGGHQCLLAPPSCFTNVTVAIDAKEDVLGSSSTGYACTIRVAGYAAADCAGAASAFVDLPTSGGVTSVSTWRTLTASGAIPPAVRSAVSVDVQVFCTGPNAFLGNSLIIDNPSIAFVP
jgi:hypothetical protein